MTGVIVTETVIITRIISTQSKTSQLKLKIKEVHLIITLLIIKTSILMIAPYVTYTQNILLVTFGVTTKLL